MLQIKTLTPEEFDNMKKNSKIKNDIAIEQKIESGDFISKAKLEHSKVIDDLNKASGINENQEDFNKLTKENMEIIKLLWAKKQNVDIASEKILEHFSKKSSYDHELELLEIRDLNSKLNEAINRMHKLTANLFKAMYSGVLIPGELTIRDHRIRRFRCQYTIHDDDFFNTLRQVNNQEAILKTLTNCEQQKISKQIFEIMKLLDDNKELIDNDYRRHEFNLLIPLKEPFLFIDRSDRVRFHFITDIHIKDYRIYFQGYNLIDYLGDTSEEDVLDVLSDPNFLMLLKNNAKCDDKESISITESNYDYFVNNFGKYLVKVSNELEKLFLFKIDFIDKATLQIQNIGSKYLIADQLLQENN